LIDLGGDLGPQMVVTSVQQLESNNVHGTFPVDLGLLSSMQAFALGSNHLVGSLPESICLWTSLTSFNVSANM
jgi:hypothetical protein